MTNGEAARQAAARVLVGGGRARGGARGPSMRPRGKRKGTTKYVLFSYFINVRHFLMKQSVWCDEVIMIINEVYT